MGQVIAVDRENSSITLHLSDTGLKDTETGKKRDIEIKLKHGKLPGGLYRGRMVRVWLTEGGTGSTFMADRIRTGRCFDRTGIRGRLRKAGRMHGAGMGGGPGRSGGHGRH